MANIVTDLVERLRASHRLMRLRTGEPKPTDSSSQTIRFNASTRRPPTVVAHKPVDDHHLRASHLGG
jgi:hypothetical protein